MDERRKIRLDPETTVSPDGQQLRSIRSLSYCIPTRYQRVAFRAKGHMGIGVEWIGFRLALEDSTDGREEDQVGPAGRR